MVFLRRAFRLSLACWLALSFLAGVPAQAQPTAASESELKAAFVLNFALFTTWPKPGPELRLCTLGEVGYMAQLRALERRSVNGATLEIAPLQSVGAALRCQVLVIGTAEAGLIDQALKTLKNSPVLTVADAGIPYSDAVHIMMVKRDDRLVFEVNQTAASRDGLSLSFKLLKLARRVS